METTIERAQAVPTPVETANENSALDDFMTARMTGEVVEAPVAPTPEPVASPVVPVKNEQAPAEPEVAAPVTPEVATVVPDIPPAEPSETPAEAEARISNRLRIEHLSDEDKVSQNRIQALTKTGMTLVEATRMILGSQLAPQPPAEVIPEQPTAIQNLETRQVEIGARLLEIGGDELNREEISALTREEMINAARLESLKILDERDQIQNRQTAAQFAEQRTNQSLSQAAKLYPAIADQNGALWQEANRIATDSTHPDYDPGYATMQNAALIVAKLAASNLGIKPAGAVAAAPTPASPSLAQPGSTVTPAAPSKGTQPAPPKPSPSEIAKRSEDLARAAIEGDYIPDRGARQPSPYVIMG